MKSGLSVRKPFLSFISAIAKCADNEYKCNNGRQCIHTSKLCDSVPDCMDDGDGDDGDDEADDLCSSGKLLFSWFTR